MNYINAYEYGKIIYSNGPINYVTATILQIYRIKFIHWLSNWHSCITEAANFVAHLFVPIGLKVASQTAHRISMLVHE